MKNITKVEIQYFRSIYWTTITNLESLNVFTGKNDAGKSNVLKALNLFFNNIVCDEEKFDFLENFNKIRAEEVRKNSIKGKQFIQIKITFCRGDNMYRTLPKIFTVTKRWLRYSAVPVTTDDLEARCKAAGLKYNDRTKSSLTKFLNSINYIYIPAIKDAKIFDKILNMLQETLYNDKLTKEKGLVESLNNLAQKVQSSAEELNKEFYEATKINANISSPQEISEFYKALSIDTVFAQSYSVKLDNRGDGIRVRYLPSILNYLAINSKKNLIWGFEEPETSVEYNLAIQMADAFVNHYSNKSMIFVTSHSPAFINLDKDDVALYRCFNDSNKTVIYEAKKAGAKPDVAIELGYFRLQEELFNEYVKKKKELDNSLEEVKLIRERIKSIELPVLITEGETDVLILRTAWEKLYTGKEMPFSIKSCDIGGEGKEAGCGILKNYLVNHTFDAPNVVIGLFDYDEAGSKAYESLKMFSSDASGAFKKSRNCKAYAIRLPAPDSKKVFIEHNNLCIEFLFDEKYLFTELEGRKLIVEKGKTHTIFQNKVIREELLSELWFGRIDKSTKMFFAERIVPTLPAEAFVNFVPLFDLLMEIVNA